LTSCSNENPLNGKTFLLLTPGVEKTTSTVLFRFSNSKYVEVFNIKDMTKSVNSYVKAPYRVDGNMFDFQGVSYKMENNKDGFDLYKGQTLKYKLLESREDIVGKLLAKSLIKKDK
jgi:hypothetical protein